MSDRILDVHSHILPAEYLAALRRTGRMQEDGFPCPSWDLAAHYAYMEEAGIDCSLLSISSPHQMLGTPQEGLELTRLLNSRVGALVRQDPHSFRFAACLPLPMIEESCREAARAFDVLGASAVKLPSNADGLYPGDSRLAPLMDVLESYRAVVVLHPCKPPVYPTGCFTAGPLPLFEFLGDTTRAVINLLTSGAVARWPHIRYIVPHTGSFLPPLVDRLSGMTQVLASRGIGEAIDVRAALANFYFDLAGDVLPAALAALATITTPDHLLFGGDFPYTPASRVALHIEELRKSPISAPFLPGILGGNAAKLLHI